MYPSVCAPVEHEKERARSIALLLLWLLQPPVYRYCCATVSCEMVQRQQQQQPADRTDPTLNGEMNQRTMHDDCTCL